ncbi:MAG: hypothetical protein ACLUHE_05370 [Christensenellales bacterium]
MRTQPTPTATAAALSPSRRWHDGRPGERQTSLTARAGGRTATFMKSSSARASSIGLTDTESALH